MKLPKYILGKKVRWEIASEVSADCITRDDCIDFMLLMEAAYRNRHKIGIMWQSGDSPDPYRYSPRRY